MLYVFVGLGLVAFASALYGILAQVQLLAIIRDGRATALDLCNHLGLQSLDELDDLRREKPDLLKVVPGPAGPYETVEFTFSPRRLAAERKRSPLKRLEGLPMRLVAVGLLITALALGHERLGGWLALVAALLIESLRWAAARALFEKGFARLTGEDLGAASPLSETAVAVSAEETVEYGEPIYEDEIAAGAGHAPEMDEIGVPIDDLPPDAAIRSFSTIVLLSRAWRPAESPLVAGLRRAGQRDAVAATPGGGGGGGPRAKVLAGDITLAARGVEGPIEKAILDYVVGQAWDWPEAAAETAGHTAHVVLASTCPRHTSPADIVRLHARAHVAIAEFAPVIAAVWPQGGRVTPAAEVPKARQTAVDSAAGAMETCVALRAFPDAGRPDAPRHAVSDTAGLFAFGLPDLELVTDGAATAEASAALRDLALNLFDAGTEPRDGTLRDGAEIDWPGAGHCRISRQRSQFDPPRDVIHIAPIETAAHED